MKIYFLSSQPCMLSLNGVFYGVTDRFERFADVSLQDKVFAKFTPEGKLPLGFFLSEELLTAPPAGCEVYLLRDGIALFAKDFPPIDFTLRPIVQQRFDDTLVSVYQQGSVQVSIQSPFGFFNAYLPPAFSVSSLSKRGNFYLIEGQNHLAVFTRKGECVLLEEILTFSTTETELNATLPLSDALGRVADCVWKFDGDALLRTQFTLRQDRASNGEQEENTIHAELLPYLFFQRVQWGENYAELLSDDLQPNAKGIVQFLGEFKGITVTHSPYIYGLIREKAPRLFEVAYYTVTVKDGKITDITG